MKMLTSLVAVCALIGFGLLFLSPSTDESGQSGTSKEKNPLYTIYKDYKKAIDQESTIDKEKANESATSLSDQSLSPDSDSELTPLESQELMTETLSKQSIEPDEETFKEKDQLPGIFDEHDSTAISMDQSSLIQADTAPDTVGFEPRNKLDHVANVELGFLKSPGPIMPTEAQTESYLERIQLAGTRASENLERTAQLLGQ